ncbi:hypothetical protein NLJ89_g2720 [Agrocybe chaxingu]|uniref:Uncharacterized protein n=1 Tax=Agrocybe chaxingu TaxID=84603 RepID=A0A9W8K5E4_9AGAR|nr:hypothetical protein NLJ89_g2720 [Agrocybe chaxingu]
MASVVKRPRKVQPSRKVNAKDGRSNKFSEGPALLMTQLTKRRAALSKVNREEPGSPIASGSLEEREERIQKLRGAITDAYAASDADSSDGKWIFLWRLLRTGVTSGRDGHWAGARKDVKIPQELDGEGLGWRIAETEAEWNEWEKRVREEHRLRDKVESWQRKVDIRDATLPDSLPREAIEPAPVKVVDAPPTASKASDSVPNQEASSAIALAKKTKVQTTIKAAAPLDPLQDSSPFGFTVVKRSSQLSGSSKPKDDKANKDDNTDKSKPSGTNIRNIPEFSFLPPSFPSSQMMTSTPKPHAKPSKPAPIPHDALPSPSSGALSTMQPPPPPVSPRVDEDLRQFEFESEPIGKAARNIRLSPCDTPPHDPHPTDYTNKRPSDDTDAERVLKKARTLPSPLVSLDSRTKTPPRTPTRPTAAPAAEGSGSTIPGLELAKASAAPATPVTPESKQKKTLPTLTELLASAKKGRSTKKPPSKAKEVEVPVVEEQSGEDPEDIIEDALDFGLGADLDIPRDENPFDLASPTKSLSSLAGDSEDEEDEIEDDEKISFDVGSFNPVATSTQIPDGRGPFVSKANTAAEGQPTAGGSQHNTDSWASIYASGSGSSKPKPNPSSHPKSSYPASSNPLRGSAYPPPASSFPNPYAYASYNSQFESAVAEQVDRVDKLLEKDVDYEGWLRDPYADEVPDDEEGAAGFGQNSLGVRDSFGVEESP